MAQTTAAISWRDCKIEMNTVSGSAGWTDISGFANSVAVSGGDRDIGALKTLSGDTPIIAGGKRNPLDVTVKVAYTEGATEPHVVATNVYEASGSSLYLRWAPSGSSAGKKLFTTSAGIVKSPVYPQGGADSGDPVTVDITITVASITPSTM